MPTPQFRIYSAVSLDGYIATPDGSVAWLDPFNTVDYGYPTFMGTIGTVILGRNTYDQALGFGDWPYRGKHTIVLTSRPLPPTPEDISTHSGDITPLIKKLQASETQDIWIDGGAKAIRAFLDAGVIGRYDLFIMPVLLGAGIKMFEPSEKTCPLLFESTKTYPNGVVRLVYHPA